MGCINSKEDPEEGTVSPKKSGDKPEQPEFSWDKKKRNREDFVVSKKKDEKIVRTPGSITGKQFVIEECEVIITLSAHSRKNCDIFVLDNTDSVTVDLCKNCRMFIGPTEGSFFIRDCETCKVIVACQQFRTRDCKNIDVQLYVTAQPTIESSKNMRFGCFQYYYPELLEQFKKAKLNPFINDWSSLYDFSQENDWTFLPQEEQDNPNFLPPIPPELYTPADNLLLTAVPLTCGSKAKPYNQSRFMLFLEGHSVEVLKFANKIKEKGTEKKVAIVQINEKQLEKEVDDLLSLSNVSKEFKEAAKKGKVIGMEVCGEGSTIQSTLDSLLAESLDEPAKKQEVVHISADQDTANHEVTTFFGFNLEIEL